MTEEEKNILRLTPCAVCQTEEEFQMGVRLVICSRCCNEKKVCTYCKNCNERLNLSLEVAHKLFLKAGLNIWRTGVVLQFEVCVSCCEDDIIPAPKIFMIQAPDSEFEFLHAAYA